MGPLLEPRPRHDAVLRVATARKMFECRKAVDGVSNCKLNTRIMCRALGLGARDLNSLWAEFQWSEVKLDRNEIRGTLIDGLIYTSHHTILLSKSKTDCGDHQRNFPQALE